MLDIDGIVGDVNNLRNSKKFNPNDESFSFSERDLPSNLNIENAENDDENSN